MVVLVLLLIVLIMFVEMVFLGKDNNVITAIKLAVLIAKFYLVGIVVAI